MHCDLCGKAGLGGDELIVHCGNRICGNCKDGYFQRIREGLPSGVQEGEPGPPSLMRRLLWITAHGIWTGLLLWLVVGSVNVGNPGPGTQALVFFSASFLAGALHFWVVVGTLKIPFADSPRLLFFPSLLVCGGLPLVGFVGCLGGVALGLDFIWMIFLAPFMVAHAVCGDLLLLAVFWTIRRVRSGRAGG